MSMQVIAQGRMEKLEGRLDRPVSYHLPLGDARVRLNDFLRRHIRLRYRGQISCGNCGRATKRSFSQGHCWSCFQKLAQCDSCIIAPERCHYDAGTCRDEIWAEEFCMLDHIVYLANSSGLKVGITRASQVPTRWIDQGAVQALALLRVRSRQQSGYAEAMFRHHITDRTNWRAMLKGEIDEIDLKAEGERLIAECGAEIDELRERFGVHAINVLNGVDPVSISYPVLNHPETVASLSFDKDPVVEGMLLGIKGQYLILDTGVINIRKHSGYDVELAAQGERA